MGMSLIGPIWLIFLCLSLVAVIVWSVKRKLYSSMSRPGIACASLPAVLMVISFYVLAIHMFVSLGGWPHSIGEAGFTPSLVHHSEMTFRYFIIISSFAIIGWPIALLVCSIVKPFRKFIGYLGVFGVSFVICFILMMMAPGQFLNWLWD